GKESIYPQEAVAIQPQGVTVRNEKAPTFQSAQGVRKARGDVNAELFLEVRFGGVAQLQLQNQLADHALFLSWCEGAINRKLSLLEGGEVRPPFVLVLKMGSADVGEGCYAQADHVGARPQKIAVEKAGAAGVSDSRVRAGDGIAGRFQFREAV